MTDRDPPIMPPPCPICDGRMTANTHMPEQLGRWECVDCWLLCDGTTGEWQRYQLAREDRQRRKERLNGSQ